jgi:tetratricopeptide (TPR) repeat protein
MNPQLRYQPGDKIGGRYQVHQALMGGMGEVYLCLDLETIQPFALKTFQQRYQTNAQRLRRAFEKEVSTWVALEKHPNIVRCFYMKPLDNQPFMILEWIAGEPGRGPDLRGWLRRGPLDLRFALDFAIDICRGLIHAQEKQPGLVHRDSKPENILIAQGGLAKVTDFGLAEIVQEAGLELDAAGVETDGRQSIVGRKGIVGTPPYMAPEQWRGESLDQRTDIYALGCMLYEVLTGAPPFQVGFVPTTPQRFQRWLSEMQAQHESNPIPALPASLPAAADNLLQSCLAKARTERPSNLSDLLRQLETLYRRQFATAPRAAPAAEEFTAVAYNNRGSTYAALQRYDEALGDYRRAIALDPHYATAYANRGNTYSDLQRYDEALRDYRRAIELDPRYAVAYVNRGVAYHALKRYDEALRDFNQAIQLNPNYALAYSSRGSTYSDLQRYDEALRDHSQAIKLGPNFARAYSNRGANYSDLQRYDEALRDFSRAVELDPGYATAYYNRGVTYSDLQRYDEALGDFSRAIELDPNLAQAYVGHGATFHALQRYDEALRDFRRAIGLDPNLAQAYYNRGSTYAALQRYDEALRDLSRAIELDPNYAQAHFNLGALLANTGQLRESLPYLEKAAQLGDPSATQTIAQIRQKLGMDPTPQIDPAQQAFEAFQRAGTAEEMQQAVARFPLLAQADFIAAIEQAIAQQVPQEHRPAFEQRLAWLRQIANEQKREE